MHRIRRSVLRGLGGLLIGLLTLSAAHAEYSVQIGTFRTPESSFAVDAEKIGTVYRLPTPSGLTRFQVGRYATRTEAEEALGALRAAGYADAYLVRKSTPLPGSVAGQRPALPDVAAAPPTALADPLAGVPASLRDRVVLLDGELHVREGGSFIPLEQYRRGSR